MNDPIIKTYEFSELALAANPRKTLNADTIADMGRSIIEHGIIQPPVAREREGRPEIYMGQRRYRGLQWAIAEATRLALPPKNESSGARLFASRAEEMARVQVIIREIADEDMRFEQWVENLQREDVLPQEEAQGFHELSLTLNAATGHNYTAAEIAKAVGRATKKGEPDEKYVLRRMKLRLAPDFFLEAVNRNEVAASTAELIGRIPDAKSRETAARMILKPEDGEQPLNYMLAQALIREKFMIALKRCGFDTTSENLVPVVEEDGVRVAGGACRDCPMRSGNNAEIQDDLSATGGAGGGKKSGVDPNLCTNPTCFREKKMAHWQMVRACALENKQQVIEGSAAKKLFGGYDGGLAYDSKLVDLAATMGHHDAGSDTDDPLKWGEVAKHADVPLVHALNPYTLNVHVLAEKATLIEKVKEAAKESGEKTIFDDSPSTGPGLSAAEKKQRAAAALKAKVSVALAHRAAERLRDRMAEKGIGLDEALLVFEVALECAGADASFFLGKMLGLQLSKEDKHGGSGRDYTPRLLKHVSETATTLAQILAWIPLAIMARDLKNNTGPYAGGVKGNEDFMRLARAYRVDVESIEAEVAAELGMKKGERGKGKVKSGKGEMKTVTRSRSAARNQASIVAAEKSEAETLTRECAHCQAQIQFKAEDEFFKHVKKCSKAKKPSSAERVKSRLKKPVPTTNTERHKSDSTASTK